MSPTPSMPINRNLRPAGAVGSTTPIAHPWRSLVQAARAGRSLSTLRTAQQLPATLPSRAVAGGGFEEGRRRALPDDDIVGQPSENAREPLTSYLHQHFSQISYIDHPATQSFRPHSHVPTSNLITPPSSFTQSVEIPRARVASSSRPPMSLPLTPSSPSSVSGQHDSPERTSVSGVPDHAKYPNSVTSLIASIFPQHAPTVSLLTHTLEILTPPSHILYGFIVDYPPPSSSGRTVFVYLPPGHGTANQRPEALSPNFSQILRPHDPMFSNSPPRDSSPVSNTAYALDIRESLTALLDLAAEALEASHCVLILNRSESEQEALGEMLHSLMYVGGQVIKPGGLEGGWEWDPMKWILVGMEL
ncbi:hypothetical protein I312_105068 [Cryptococcus bacillisporus CA1280]|uniref:uncharacterized protein n=1 Tax=Cryptococcus bacillisporus CA1280 TaxID=1296109 RepID=UPI0033663D5F